MNYNTPIKMVGKYYDEEGNLRGGNCQKSRESRGETRLFFGFLLGAALVGAAILFFVKDKIVSSAQNQVQERTHVSR